MSEDFVFGRATDEEGEGAPAPSFVTGTYIVTCVSVEDAGKSKFPKTDPRSGEPLLDPDGNPIYPEQWKWVLRIDDVDAKRPTEAQQGLVGQEIHRWTNKVLGPRSNTRAFIEALIGRPLKQNEQPTLKWVLNRQALATILKVNDQGRIKEFALAPYDNGNADSNGGGSKSEKQAILDELYDAQSQNQLADLWERIQAAKLGQDREVMSVYWMTDKTLNGE